MTQHKHRRRESKRSKRREVSCHFNAFDNNPTELLQDYQTPRNLAPIQARNPSQRTYIDAVEQAQLTFATGPAGTGKTWLCAALAAQALIDKAVEKIVITRPVVEAHENMGFLPGAVEDKFAPYFAPFREVLEERLGRGHVTALIKGGRIEMAPLAYMRGRSFKQSFVVLDEAQNTNPAQMKLFLTRIGEGSVVVVNGDFAQQDIAGECGLSDAVQRFAKLEGIAHVQFGRADIVRSGLVQQIVEGYEPVLQSAQLCA